MTHPSPARNRFERHRKKVIALMLLTILLAAEIAMRVLAYHGVVHYKRYRTDHNPKFWADINRDFGTWHYANAELVHRSACFTVTYRANSFGARDIERQRRSPAPRRVVVLGDSFVEGYGVAAEDRMTNIIEHRTGIEHLNFGTSGSFGSIQEWLLYKTLASDFDHTEVFVFFLPDNDFADNDPGRWSGDRYRPYVRKRGSQYEVYYPVSFEDRAAGARYTWPRILKHHIYNNVYLVNVIKQELLNSERWDAARDRPEVPEHKIGGSTYDVWEDADLEILFYTYDQIRSIARGRPVRIFIIPRLGDLVEYDRRGYDFKVVEVLGEYGGAREDVTVVDLLPHFVEYAAREGIDYREFYFPCDGHWSPLGHEVVAGAVIEAAYGAGSR